jgi:hypothetical protein
LDCAKAPPAPTSIAIAPTRNLKVIESVRRNGIPVFVAIFTFSPSQEDSAGKFYAGPAALGAEFLYRLLEARHAAARHAKDSEELVPERLRFGPLALGVLPFARKGDRFVADFGPGEGHGD